MSAMWSGRVDRFVPPLLRRASRSIWDMSPTSSRRLSSSRSRKCSNSRLVRPAWFLRGLPSVGTASGMGRFTSGSCRDAGRAEISRVLTWAPFFGADAVTATATAAGRAARAGAALTVLATRVTGAGAFTFVAALAETELRPGDDEEVDLPRGDGLL